MNVLGVNWGEIPKFCRAGWEFRRESQNIWRQADTSRILAGSTAHSTAHNRQFCFFLKFALTIYYESLDLKSDVTDLRSHVQDRSGEWLYIPGIRWYMPYRCLLQVVYYIAMNWVKFGENESDPDLWILCLNPYFLTFCFICSIPFPLFYWDFLLLCVCM
jgi:hypothetical protein